MGEFDVIIEDVFQNGSPTQEPLWYPLQSKRSGKKKEVVSGEILLQFSLVDPIDPAAGSSQIMRKFLNMVATTPSPDEDDDDALRLESGEGDDLDEESSDEQADGSDKRRSKLRLARLKKKATQRAYEFSGKTEVAGVLFVEIVKVTDLPPESNGKHIRTSACSLVPDSDLQ